MSVVIAFVGGFVIGSLLGVLAMMFFVARYEDAEWEKVDED